MPKTAVPTGSSRPQKNCRARPSTYSPSVNIEDGRLARPSLPTLPGTDGTIGRQGPAVRPGRSGTPTPLLITKPYCTMPPFDTILGLSSKLPSLFPAVSSLRLCTCTLEAGEVLGTAAGRVKKKKFMAMGGREIFLWRRWVGNFFVAVGGTKIFFYSGRLGRTAICVFCFVLFCFFQLVTPVSYNFFIPVKKRLTLHSDSTSPSRENSVPMSLFIPRQ